MEASHSSDLLDLFKAFNVWDILILDLATGDSRDLMEVANSSLDHFDQNESLHDGITGTSNL